MAMDTSSFQFSSWSALPTTATSNRESPPSAALDLFASIATSNVKVYSLDRFKAHFTEARTIGRGGFAVVEQGNGPDDKVVAIKHNRPDSKIPASGVTDAFERHLHQTCLELRILSHPPLRSHPNIVDIVGICLGEVSGQPQISLVLEFAEFGNLYAFLSRGDAETSIDDRHDLVTQVARGLEVLHHCKICHGDVKIRNVLISRSAQGRWVAKVADFGHAVVAREDSSANVDIGWGTRLLTAPEIRTGEAFQTQSFSIQQALHTDVYSFGLLVWEVMQDGASFFDNNWLESGDADDIAKENYLNKLPHNGLLEKALDFSARQVSSPIFQASLQQVFLVSLQDEPPKRWTMKNIRKHLENRSDDMTIIKQEAGPQAQPLCAWNSLMSITEAFTSVETSYIVQDLPLDVQTRVQKELEALANCNAISSLARGHSAICVSECYIVGFGAPQDVGKMIGWTLKAAEEDCYGYMRSWHHRLCSTFAIEPDSSEDLVPGIGIEEKLAEVPPQLYLISRVHLFVRLAVLEVSKTADETLRSSPTSTNTDCLHLALFGGSHVDELFPIHVAAFIGNNELLLQLSSDIDLNRVSKCGLNAAHYACMGGHLSTLKLLIDQGIDLTALGTGSISLIHLCVFFPGETAVQVFNLLKSNGARSDVSTTHGLYWRFHDIYTQGTPLDWAVEVRHAPLVGALLTSDNIQNALGKAVRRNFWDIVHRVVTHGSIEKISLNTVTLNAVERPFAHWIAHGPDRKSAMEHTLRMCRDYSLLTSSHNGSSMVHMLLTVARIEDDFILLEACLDLFPSSHAIEENERGFTVLGSAIVLSKSRPIWRTFLVKLAGMHTIVELQKERVGSHSYLHHAVVSDNVIAARVLLERGVDVEQPTFDEGKHTPLQLCFADRASPDMYRLLVEYGADITRKGTGLALTPLQLGLARGVNNFNLLTLGLGKDNENMNISDILLFMLKVAVEWESTELVDYLDPFRLVLTWERAAPYINSVDEFGLTLIQRAAYHLHADCVSLLLESGADASILVTAEPGAVPMLPLEIACRRGRLCWYGDPNGVTTTHARATAVANELLRWHCARNDGWFQGITKLHLAAFMRSLDEVQRLIGVGYDTGAKGVWPGISGKVSPTELMDFVTKQRGEHAVRLTPDMRLCPEIRRDEGTEDRLYHVALTELEIRDLLQNA